jgi:regulator of protease activity HflC (stomatin/prohibitin superfamily)
MVLLIITIVLLLLAVGAIIVNKVAKRVLADEDSSSYAKDGARDAKMASKPIGAGLLAVALLLTIWSSFVVVPANTVGIPVVFGKPKAPLQSGFHVVTPFFTSVEEFSTRVQKSERLLSPSEGDATEADCVNTKASDGARLCVDVTVRFTINKNKAGDLYRKYGSFDDVRGTLVRRVTEDSLREVYGDYTPDDAVSGKFVGEIKGKVRDQLKTDLAENGITLDSVSVGDLHLDEETQKRVDSKIQARQDAERAIIEKQKTITVAEGEAEAARTKAKGEADAKITRATAEAEANVKIQASLSPLLVDKIRAEALSKANTIYVPQGSDLLIGQAPAAAGGK